MLRNIYVILVDTFLILFPNIMPQQNFTLEGGGGGRNRTNCIMEQQPFIIHFRKLNFFLFLTQTTSDEPIRWKGSRSLNMERKKTSTQRSSTVRRQKKLIGLRCQFSSPCFSLSSFWWQQLAILWSVVFSGFVDACVYRPSILLSACRFLISLWGYWSSQWA